MIENSAINRPIHQMNAYSVYNSSMVLTFLTLDDVPDAPGVLLTSPEVRVGDLMTLRYRLRRQKQGRSETLDVTGEHRVTGRTIDISKGTARQILRVASTGKAPAWRAVKNEPPRRLSPAKSPKTLIS